MSAGINATEEADGPLLAQRGISNVYADDRSFASTMAAGLLQKVENWSDWSLSIGLQKSPAKTQLTAVKTSRISAT